MHVMYAQVEQARTVQDYPPFRSCVRLVGVEEPDFTATNFNAPQGCKTYFIDIAWDYFFELTCTRSMQVPWIFGAPWTCCCDGVQDDWPSRLWVRLEYTRSQALGAYFYEIFGNEDEASNITVQSIQLVAGPAVSPPPSPWSPPRVLTVQTFKLSAFHVGQGMCALLYGTSDAILLDAGAGTPIKRMTYRKWMKSPTSTAFANDLRARTATKTLQAIISHPDSDHWRLLDWDSTILSATTNIYTPSSTPALALKSSRVIGKVSSLAGSTSIANGPTGPTLLEAHRSSPSTSDRNGECLVVETRTGIGQKHLCLFPGDYVYDRMATDGVAAIKALASAKLDAVMVPHHGDAASAAVSVSPKIAGRTNAFFSAGTHAGYGHPTSASLKAHTAANFLNVSSPTCTDILEHPLP